MILIRNFVLWSPIKYVMMEMLLRRLSKLLLGNMFENGTTVLICLWAFWLVVLEILVLVKIRTTEEYIFLWRNIAVRLSIAIVLVIKVFTVRSLNIHLCNYQISTSGLCWIWGSEWTPSPTWLCEVSPGRERPPPWRREVLPALL